MNVLDFVSHGNSYLFLVVVARAVTIFNFSFPVLVIPYVTAPSTCTNETIRLAYPFPPPSPLAPFPFPLRAISYGEGADTTHEAASHKFSHLSRVKSREGDEGEIC